MYSWKENITAGRYFYAKHDRGGGGGGEISMEELEERGRGGGVVVETLKHTMSIIWVCLKLLLKDYNAV